MCKSVNYVSAVFNVMVRLDLPSDVTGLTCQLLYFHAVILIRVIYTYAFAPSFACKVTTHTIQDVFYLIFLFHFYVFSFAFLAHLVVSKNYLLMILVYRTQN